jgi:hypothetical protein
VERWAASQYVLVILAQKFPLFQQKTSRATQLALGLGQSRMTGSALGCQRRGREREDGTEAIEVEEVPDQLRASGED